MDLVTFTEEILNGKLHILCIVRLPIAATQSYLSHQIFKNMKREIRDFDASNKTLFLKTLSFLGILLGNQFNNQPTKTHLCT